MVVTRRAVPPTPGSRSGSSQAVPRMAKVRVNQLNQPEHSSPLANGKSKLADTTDLTATPKLKPKSKWRRKSSPKQKKGTFRRFVDLLFKVYLAWLAVYWVFVCQNPDQSSGSSICYAISATRENVLKPYAYPLIKRALSYPPVEPYVKEIEPHVNRAQDFLQPVAATVISKFSAHIIPEWNNRVVPQYQTYVAPHVQRVLVHLDPYVAVVETEYERYLAPYARFTIATAWKLQKQARPYVVLMWHKCADGYKYAKPYARPAWKKFKDAVFRVLAYLAVFRRRFVDPHVAQMWAKIKELSGDEAGPTTTTPEPMPIADIPVEEPSTVAAILAEEDTHTPVPTPTPIPHPVLSDDEAAPPEAPYVTAATPVPQEGEPTPTPTRVPKESTPAPSVDPSDEGDFELFSTEIDLDLDEFEDVVKEETQSSSPDESEEEREARLKARAEENAWKRKEIVDRHTDWEYQLQDLRAEQTQIFKLALYNARKTAAKMLKKDSSVQRAIDEFAADGERYLKGVESYLKNLVKEKKQDKGTLWERVIQKVEDKFEKKLDGVDRKVGDWYNELAANERELVDKTTATVAEFAQKAQVDLGLDYSWLDDVTVEDWVRYHDLMRSSDSFHEEVLMIRNGTHVEALDNPVFRALKELRVEVDDIVTGFKSRLRRIQRDGERVFGSSNRDEDPSDSDPAGDPSQVTIGKSPEQVEEALKEAPLEDWAASRQKKDEGARTHEEL